MGPSMSYGHISSILMKEMTLVGHAKTDIKNGAQLISKDAE